MSAETMKPFSTYPEDRAILTDEAVAIEGEPS